MSPYIATAVGLGYYLYCSWLWGDFKIERKWHSHPLQSHTKQEITPAATQFATGRSRRREINETEEKEGGRGEV
ncbi:hypothetical protein L211DRAFT_840356 [Terfezia boudieri ATCC MYA-4762]|uniref:Uncharacterized protein n=1 Tax=Terfezia boudieri ATCC MYA-4762 TaxID=1051890 RepID=A0A3N4LUN8_9PEZI|nr:hypothetical protein L211DRAFT_840356 [Terfezia boudieri ATCC MYA-4762]